MIFFWSWCSISWKNYMSIIITKIITRSEIIVWNKNNNRSKIGKTDILSLLSKSHFESKDEISVLQVLHLLVFLFRTMFSLMVILFVIKLYAQNDTFQLYNDLPFWPERMEIDNAEKLVTNLHDKTEYVIHIRNLKQALNHGLILKKTHKTIKFNQKAWLKAYIDLHNNQDKKQMFLRRNFSSW